LKEQPPTSIAKLASHYAGLAFLIDASLVIGSALLATLIRSRFDGSFIDNPQSLTIRLIGYSFIWIGGLYLRSSWARSNFLPGIDSLKSVASASWRVALIIFATLYLIKMPISRIWVGTMLITTALSLVIGRLIFQGFLNKQFSRYRTRRVLVVCHRADFAQTKRELQGFAEGQTFEFYRVSPPKKNSSKDWIAEIKGIIKRNSLDTVLIGLGSITETSHFLGLSDETRNNVLEVLMVSRISPIISRLDQGESINLLKIREPKILDSGRFIKRCFDIVLGTVFLLVSLPIMLVAALGVKLTSKGSILYVDRRVGLEGNTFLFPKLRSMYAGSSDFRLEVLGRPDAGMRDRYKKDPRITPVGRFLRRWSIDELPQLWCVVIGTMTLVGPRPILHQEMPQVLGSHQSRFIAKPGLTGLWQTSGRKLTSWEERMSSDIAYVQDWSLAKDFALIFRTIGALLSGKGSL